MKKELKQLLCAAALGLLWPATAWATTAALGEGLASIPIADWLATMILSTVLGATALLHWMIDEYEQHEQIPRLALQVASRMLSSNAAGLLTFMALGSWDIDKGYKAGAIMLAAFGGAVTIQRALQFVQNKYIPEPSK
jgi:hypothetical protein